MTCVTDFGGTSLCRMEPLNKSEVPNEALGLAMGSGGIGFSSDVFKAELFAGGGDGW